MLSRPYTGIATFGYENQVVFFNPCLDLSSLYSTSKSVSSGHPGCLAETIGTASSGSGHEFFG